MLNNRNSDKIYIRDLMLQMSVGIYDHEKASKQPVIVNITIDVESNAGKTLSSIGDVISYEGIVNAVIDLSKSKHYDLLESFAEDIANICLNENRCLNVTVSTDKPDIIESCRTVGVKIRRSQKN